VIHAHAAAAKPLNIVLLYGEDWPARHDPVDVNPENSKRAYRFHRRFMRTGEGARSPLSERDFLHRTSWERGRRNPETLGQGNVTATQLPKSYQALTLPGPGLCPYKISLDRPGESMLA